MDSYLLNESFNLGGVGVCVAVKKKWGRVELPLRIDHPFFVKKG